MKAVLAKVEAAHAAHLDELKEGAKRDKQSAKAKPLADRRRATWTIAKASPRPDSKAALD